jgi:hypothetical protein
MWCNIGGPKALVPATLMLEVSKETWRWYVMKNRTFSPGFVKSDNLIYSLDGLEAATLGFAH